MKIEHVSLYVNSLEAMMNFYIKYFNAAANSQYHNPKTGLKTYFLTFESGTRLEIMSRPDMHQSEKKPAQTGYIHIAFSLGSKENVDCLTKRLADDGYTVLSAPRTTGDGYYESCVLDPENNQIEITE